MILSAVDPHRRLVGRVKGQIGRLVWLEYTGQMVTMQWYMC